MEEEAPPRRSVAELAGKFKGSTPPVGITSGHEADRARVSLRRRPPSRRHRKSSCEDEASVTADTRQNSCPEVMENSGGRGGGGGEEEVVFRKEGQTEDSSAPEKTELCEEETEISTDVEKEDKEGVWSSSRLKEEFEEKHLEEKQEQDSEM
uniref:Duboraya n=1 Tax=Nothobranchius kuhntae TaxID=321403 RepID=A0A1A8JQR8_NOTKU